jgi:isoleucyl-tRNA synthetase
MQNFPSANETCLFLEPHWNISFAIWTTTPWTLPTNFAVTINSKVAYLLIKSEEEHFIVGEALVQEFTPRCQFSNFEIVRTFSGADLENLVTKHPFIERESPIVLANYVTTDAGTGCVHMAPRHGLEDYVTGWKYTVPIDCPIDDDDCDLSDGQVPAVFVGVSVLDINGHCNANEIVLEYLKKKMCC